MDAEDIALALSVLTVLTVAVSVFLVATTVAKFSAFVSTSADAMISIDEDQRIMTFNESAEKIFGWSQAQVIGKPINILIPERFRAVHVRHVKGFAAGPGTARRMGGGAAITGLRMNGEEFLADSSISAIVVSGKKFLVVALRDISELKRSETEQRLLAEVGAALAETLELDDILTMIARLSVRDLADYCIVDVVEDDGSIRRARAVCRNPDRTWICDALMRTPLDGDRPRLAWPVLKTGKANLIEKVTPDALTSWARNDEERSALHECPLPIAHRRASVGTGKTPGRTRADIGGTRSAIWERRFANGGGVRAAGRFLRRERAALPCGQAGHPGTRRHAGHRRPRPAQSPCSHQRAVDGPAKARDRARDGRGDSRMPRTA